MVFASRPNINFFEKAEEAIELTGKEIIEKIAREEGENGIDYLISKMMPKERAAHLANPKMGSRFTGQVVHRQTDKIAKEMYPDPRFKYSTKGPDFYDTETGELIELSTTKGVKYHWDKYKIEFPDLEIATYNLPVPKGP